MEVTYNILDMNHLNYVLKKKLINIEKKYSEIWLILIDTIFSRVDNTTKQDFEKYPKIQSFFKRIIIISENDSSKYIYLYE